MGCDEETTPAELIGVVAHWLAAEYIVLEGWRQLEAADANIEMILALYPDHSDVLRKCRNAVYHFQTEILDARIINCVNDEDEELSFAVALHFEFQRYLFQFPDRFMGTAADLEELRIDLD
jgi:hypothetical protein